MGVAEEDLRDEYGLDYNPRADYLETPYTGKRAVASWLPFDGWNYKVRDQRSTTMINAVSYTHLTLPTKRIV